MARPSAYESSSEEDEFPDINTLVQRTNKKTQGLNSNNPRKSSKATEHAAEGAKTTKTPAVRRRKLGQLPDNLLLKPWSRDGTPTDATPSTANLTGSISRPRVQLRARKQESTAQITPIQGEAEQEKGNSAEEEETFIEEATVDDDSDFNETLDFYSAEEDNLPSLTSLTKPPPDTLRRQPTTSRPKSPPKKMEQQSKKATSKSLEGSRSALSLDDDRPKLKETRLPKQSMSRGAAKTNSRSAGAPSKSGDDMADLLERMDM